MADTAYELDLTGRLTPDLAGEDLLDAVDAASDQDRTTWLTASGKRIAKITPAAGIPDGTLDWFSAAYLIQVMARQVEEIHRALGLERDDEGNRVDDDPLGPPWYGKQAEATARLASGDLIMVSRDQLLQVLRDTGLISGITDENRYESAWQALRGPARPAGVAPVGLLPWDPPRKRKAHLDASVIPAEGPVDRKFVPDGPLTVQVVQDVLSLAGVTVALLRQILREAGEPVTTRQLVIALAERGVTASWGTVYSWLQDDVAAGLVKARGREEDGQPVWRYTWKAGSPS